MPRVMEDRGVGAACAVSQIMKEILKLVNWFAQERVPQSIVKQISGVSGPFDVASCGLPAMKFVRQERVRVQVVVEAVDVDVDVVCGGMVLALWEAAILRRAEPPGAQGATHVLGTGTRQSKWPTSGRCGCGSRVRDRGVPSLQLGAQIRTLSGSGM